MNLNLELANKCREIRQNSGLTIKEWANNLGLKREQIISFEKGVNSIPTLVLVEYAKLKKEKERGNKKCLKK